MLFHGPCKEVMPFFQGLGFDIPERKGIPDFLQEVSGLRDQEVLPWPRNLKNACVCPTHVRCVVQGLHADRLACLLSLLSS